MDRELISVIVPVYQSEGTLSRCVESILNQTYSHLEVLLVDDGSTDNSPALCDLFSRRDKRVRVIHQENRGVSAARNAGIEASAGEWITFVDSDDRIVPEFCEALLSKAHLGFDMAVCGYREEFYAQGKRIRQRDVMPQFTDSRDDAGFIQSWKLAFDDNLLFFPSMKLYKARPIREKGIRFDPAVSFGEDVLFNQCCWRKLGFPKLGVVRDLLYCYQHSEADSLSKRHFARFETRVEESRAIFLWKLGFVRQAGLGKEAEACVAKLHLRACFADMELLFDPVCQKKQSAKQRREYLEKILFSEETTQALMIPPFTAEHRIYRCILGSRWRLLIKGAAWGRLQVKRMRNFLRRERA